MSSNDNNIQSPAKGSKTSKASDFSKNETNKTPMELQSPQNQPKQKKWFVKKFFMKIGERVGTVKQTEFDDEYLAAVKEVDEYYSAITDVCNQCSYMIQPNPVFLAKGTDMEVGAPVGKDPLEELCQHLKLGLESYKNVTVLSNARQVLKKLAVHRREMQKNVKEAASNLRAFLNSEYPKLDYERQMVLKFRQDMDYYKNDGANNADATKILQFKQSQKAFQKQTETVIKMIRHFIDVLKIEHIDDLVKILRALHVYHAWCEKECFSLRPTRASLGDLTNYDDLFPTPEEPEKTKK